MAIVPTAIIPPRAQHLRITRQRLAGFIDSIDASRVTTVFSPAGYGKTTATVQWAELLSQRGRPILWLAARACISSFKDFLEALGAAAAAAGLEDCSNLQGATAAKDFARGVALQKNKPVLVIDDAQELPREVFSFLEKVASSARDSMTTIIVSRSLNTIPVARLRSLGYLFEIDEDDLRFTVEEASELVAAAGRGPVDAIQLQQLVEDTQGWVAGLTMACSIKKRHRQCGGLSFATRPSGLRREFETYFDEEVLSRESREVRDFLISTMVLDELTPAACAAVTGRDDARSMLERVEEAGLFLRAADSDRSSYRYHPLFREMAMRRLNDRDPARAMELQRRASVYFVQARNPRLAVQHAERSGDVDFLANQLEELAEPLTYQGDLWLLDQLVSNMPSSIFAQRPRLALAIAWRRIRSLAFEAAESLIRMAEVEYDRLCATDGDSMELQRLEQKIEHRWLMLAAARDDMTAIENRAETLLRKFGDDESYLSCTLLAQLMASRRELYHFQDILRLEAEVRRALGRPGSDFASISLKASIAPTLAVQGKVDAAESTLREALDYARSVGLKGVAALPALPLAELLYDCGKTEEAGDLVSEFLPVARQWGFIDQIASGHLVQARLVFNKGDLIGAQKVLNEMQLLAIEYGLDRLRAYAVSEQVRMLIRSGEPRQARQALASSGMLIAADDAYPTLNPTRRHEAIATAVIRIEMQEHRLVHARKIAKRWSQFVRRNSATRSAIIFELLMAEIAVLAGDRSEARRAVRDAVTLAAPTGWTQVFIDEGDAIHSLITESYGHGPTLDTLTDQFGERLVATIKGKSFEADESDYGPSSRLANREIDILRMVSGGLRNREIGERLGLTEGTVKWYMQQIYDKLGVRRRPQAVTRARQLGVLA